jgi:hypothetical protein
MRQLSSADDSQAREFVEQLLNSEILAEFKSSVDTMRHLMWIYIEAVSRSGGPSTIVQSDRLRRAVDMLRMLQESPAPEHFAGPETFFERVQNVVDGYDMEAELAKKRDAA